MKTGVKNLLMAMLFSFVMSTVLFAMIMLVSEVSRADSVTDNLNATTVRVNNATGSIVEGKSGKRYILTNWHVCTLVSNPSYYITGQFDDGSNVVGAVASNDVNVDLCAAVIDKNLPALRVSNKDDAKELYTKGYPNGTAYTGHGVAKQRFGWHYKVAGQYFIRCPKNSEAEYWQNGDLRSCILHWTSVLTTLYSRPGSSGSPVLDDEGRLVGVMSSHDDQNSDYAGGMVPIEQLRAFLDKL